MDISGKTGSPPHGSGSNSAQNQTQQTPKRTPSPTSQASSSSSSPNAIKDMGWSTVVSKFETNKQKIAQEHIRADATPSTLNTAIKPSGGVSLSIPTRGGLSSQERSSTALGKKRERSTSIDLGDSSSAKAQKTSSPSPTPSEKAQVAEDEALRNMMSFSSFESTKGKAHQKVEIESTRTNIIQPGKISTGEAMPFKKAYYLRKNIVDVRSHQRHATDINPKASPKEAIDLYIEKSENAAARDTSRKSPGFIIQHEYKSNEPRHSRKAGVILKSSETEQLITVTGTNGKIITSYPIEDGYSGRSKVEQEFESDKNRGK